eukprot:scaffold4247_cov174-Ochromonas_danica.AAC.28
MIIIVFVVALLKQNVFLVLFLLLVEILAGCWYSISYIPFARKIVITFFRSLGICYPCFYVHDNVKASCEKCQKKNNSSSSGTGIMGSGKGSSSNSTSSMNVFATKDQRSESSTGFSSMFGGGSKK